MGNRYKLASDFKPLPGEANFPPPIQEEVVGGVHIAPECITRAGDRFIMIEWPNGLPRHETNRTVRFPHGLMRFGEAMEQCAQRLVKEQLGMKVKSVRVLYIDSYLDKMNHWHIEPGLLVEVGGDPKLPKEAGGVIYFRGYKLPKGSVWTIKEFKEVVDNLIK